MLPGHYLLLFLGLPLLARCIKDQESEHQSSGDFETKLNGTNHEPTFVDDEDFDGKVPVTFYASTEISCTKWEKQDRDDGSQTLINKMIVYVASICECAFNTLYLTPLESKCDPLSGALLVSTNITLPYNQQHAEFVTYLENWIMTEPRFVKVLKDATTRVNVVNVELMHIHVPSPGSGSGSGSGEPPTSIAPTTDPEPVDEFSKYKNETESGSGSASGDNEEEEEEDDFESSSVTISINIYQLLFACAVVLSLLHS